MSSDVEIDRALAAVTETINDRQLREFNTGRVQEIVPTRPPWSRLRKLMTILHVRG